MKQQFVTFKTANLAKIYGFNWPCAHYYKKDRLKEERVLQDDGEWKTISSFGGGDPKFYHPESEEVSENYNNKEKVRYIFWSAPEQWLLQNWLRYKRGIHIIIKPEIMNGELLYYKNNIIQEKDLELVNNPIKEFKTYEEALEDALYKSLTAF